jgi:integrase
LLQDTKALACRMKQNMAKPVKHYDGWRVRWFNETGHRKSETFSTRSEAEFYLKQKEAEVARIKRGLQPGELPEKYFTELCDYWLKHKAAFKRSAYDDQLMVKRHLVPFFGHMLIKNIKIEHVDAFKLSRKHLNIKTIHNHLTLLISMLNLAIELGWILEKPKIKKPRISLFSKDFRFLKTDEEISMFLRTAKEEGEDVFACYSTAVYTGLRVGELSGLKWNDIDFEKRLISVQCSYSGPTKSGDIRYVPILDPLLPVLKAWRLQCKNEFVFPNQAGKMQIKCAKMFDEIFHRVLEYAGFPKIEINGKLRNYIRFHDLRHTFASHWVMKGGDIFKLQKILGHKSITMTLRYAHLAPNAFSEDYARFGKSVQTEDGIIIPIGKAANPS